MAEWSRKESPFLQRTGTVCRKQVRELPLVYIESVLSIWWWHCKGGCWFYTLKIMPWKFFVFFLMWVSFELIALRQSANQKVIWSQQTCFLIHVMHLCVRLSVNLQLWGVNIRAFYLFIYFLNWHLISNVVFSNEAH